MLRRCMPIITTLRGRTSATPIIRALSDASKHPINKPARERSSSCTGPLAKKCTNDEIIHAAQGYTSARIPDNRPSSANKRIHTQDVSQVQAAQANRTKLVTSNRHQREPSRTQQEHTSSVDILITFLSGKNMKSCNPQTYDADVLRSLLMSAESAGHLGKLDQHHLSSLIGLFGTITIFPTCTSLYANPLASHVTNQPPRTYWSTIIQMAMEKESMGWELTSSDRYWLMRANLAIVNASTQETPLGFTSQQKDNAMSRARREYCFICHQSYDPELHGPYFEALLSLQTPEHLCRAADDLCELLSWSYALQHPRLLAVLWQIVLRSSSDLSEKSKEALLRVSTSGLSGHVHELPQTEIIVPGSNACIESSGIIGLTNLLTAATFSPSPFSKDESISVEYKWILSEARANFAPHIPFAQRWRSLVLLALCNTASVDHTSYTGTITQAETVNTDWDVISVLATIQKSINCIGRLDLPDSSLKLSIQHVGWSLWTKWCKSSASRPKHMSRIVAGSFFWLAAIAKDAALTSAVDRHCISSELWSIEDNETSETTQVASLATEYIYASINCGTGLQDVVASLRKSFGESHWPSVIREIFSHISLQDIRIASQLYSLVRDTTSLPMDSIHSLAMSLASQGLVNVAVPFFLDSGMSPSQTLELLNAVLLALAKSQQSVVHPDVATVMGDVMDKSYKVLPPALEYRAVIQHVLPVIASSNHARKAGAIFETVLNSSPFFFDRSFILRFLSVLIKHRQSRLIARVLPSLVKLHPQHSQAFRKVAILGLCEIAPKYAKQVNDTTWDGKDDDDLLKIALTVDCHLSVSGPSSLKISSTMVQHASNGRMAQYIMKILLLGSRIMAAKRLFFTTRELLDPPARTSLGNAILNFYAQKPLSYTDRYMNNVLSAYNYLIQHGNLVPDRVTVNTMLKAILRWQDGMDSVKLRILFDHLVRNGYPGDSHGQVPFGTSASTPQIFKLPELDEPLLFEKHVKPMLKMFIKAFHLRHDVTAAFQVIGILKSTQATAITKRDRRRRARNAGKRWIGGNSNLEVEAKE